MNSQIEKNIRSIYLKTKAFAEFIHWCEIPSKSAEIFLTNPFLKVPGGNRDQRAKLIQAKKYPMKSAIQKNLGGPLSEVFFSNLNSVQQDHVGYTPKLQGPGENLWVSPSDNLMGSVVLRPPFTTRIRQALTHKGILSLGIKSEEKVIRWV